ncbi:MAG: S41 family peptidase [Bryobacteraceae bacterium]
MPQTRDKLNYKQRERIFDKVYKLVIKHYFDPKFNGTDWPTIAQSCRQEIVGVDEPEAFETAMHGLVRRLGTSHTGFFHQSVRRVPARLAVGASFSRNATDGGAHWVASDVHGGGPAELAGLKPGDVLVSVNDRPLLPPEQPMFAMGAEFALAIRRADEQHTLRVVVPLPRSRKQPYCEPRAVESSQLDQNTGYLKVSILPGLLGLDVAREIDAAVAELSSCDRLVLDLRGHLGGGLGVLRLMSYLTPENIPIGFTLSRKRAELGYEKEKLPRLDRLPTHLPNPFGVASLAFRFGGRDSSVVLVSEGLGPQRWHGRIAILVNEHTVSAGEMVAAFAAENKLAVIVGTETAGRLIPGSGTKVGEGYMLIMPRAQYITWQGRRFEGKGIEPELAISLDQTEAGTDGALATARRALDDCGAVAIA